MIKYQEFKQHLSNNKFFIGEITTVDGSVTRNLHKSGVFCDDGGIYAFHPQTPELGKHVTFIDKTRVIAVTVEKGPFDTFEAAAEALNCNCCCGAD